MAFHYIGVDEAMARSGLRMVVVGGIPSLWGEAAKGILHVKRLDWAAVRLVYDSEALKSWAGQLSGPVLIHDDDAPRSGWPSTERDRNALGGPVVSASATLIKCDIQMLRHSGGC